MTIIGKKKRDLFYEKLGNGPKNLDLKWSTFWGNN